jgi:tetratricopeptide (TPR) repeat protein
LGMGFAVCIASAFFMAGSLFALFTIFGGAVSIGRPAAQTIDFGQVLLFYLGQATRIDPSAQRLMLSIFPRDVFYLRLAYIVLSLIVAFGLLTRKRIFYLLYIANLVVAVVGLLLNSQLGRSLTVIPASSSVLERIFGVVVNELFGVFLTVTGWLAGGLLLLQVVLAFVIERDFDKKTERWWCAIDPSVRDATGAFMRARSFMKREMWVMAIRYLQRAISIQPNVIDYYLALAESYARLGRYPQSLRILDQAQYLRPDSDMVEKLRGVILELQARTMTTPAEPMGGL